MPANPTLLLCTFAHPSSAHLCSPALTAANLAFGQGDAPAQGARRRLHQGVARDACSLLVEDGVRAASYGQSVVLCPPPCQSSKGNAQGWSWCGTC
ncbi:hypothetical protein NFJ02_32g81140 [Pycnococcus provasolii]